MSIDTTVSWIGTRPLGHLGSVGALGLGCWAIGGPASLDGKPIGWGEVDDAESIRAIARALELGVSFFDTAPVYGAGHSERVLGRALAGRRRDVTIATKFGLGIDEPTRRMTDVMVVPDPARIRAECEASLRRLGVDVIDLYLCHAGGYGAAEAAEIRDVCEELVSQGKIRAHGWSTDDPAGAAVFARGPHCAAVEHELNLFSDAPAMLDLCARTGIASVDRSPLAMGLLTGKFSAGSRLAMDDVRGDEPAWMKWFSGGAPRPKFLDRLETVREILTSGGRTPAQGALGWIWARSGRTIPIPGFRTVAQVEGNAGALSHGPLTPGQLSEVALLLAEP